MNKIIEGKIIVFSAPSGAGKTTIVKKLLELGFPLNFSISATTRNMRVNESNGVDYHFLNVPQFKKKISSGDFIEWQEVYPNQFYGSLHSEVDKLIKSGKNVVFDIDVQGGINIKKIYGKTALTIFILPPSINELENRLRSRGSENEEALTKRLNKAEEEISFAKEFDIRIVNENLEKSVREISSIINKFLNQ